MTYEQRSIKLSDSETLLFLELYRNESLLYDSTMEQYRDRNLRAAAAKRISDEMNISGFGPSEVLVKFKNLRNSYCQELKKIAASTQSATSPDEVYKPKVVWFDLMNSFIYRHVQQRTNPVCLITTPKLQNDGQNDSDDTNDEFVLQEVSDKISFPTLRQRPVTTSKPALKKCLQQNEISSHQKGPLPKKKKLQQNRPKETHFMKEALNKVVDLTARSRTDKDDAYDHFGRYIASMLRSIGPPDAMMLQQQITIMITDRISGNFNSTSNLSPTHSNNSSDAFSPTSDQE